jgi:RNA polymerase sigma-70 factor (ECF subfamily)
MMLNDAELVAAALQGEASAFEELVRRYQDAVFAVALSVTRSYADAEDVSQETFLRAYAKLGDLREPSNFGAWVMQIARSRAIDLVRERKRRQLLTESHREVVGRRGELASKDALAVDVEHLLENLSETLSETVLLYYVDGYSQKEVGELLKVPLGTVKRRLHDARRTLKREALTMAADELHQKKPGPELPELVSALREFGRELREGIPVSRILKGIADDVKSERLRNALDTMYNQIMAGSTLGEAVIQFPDLFPPTVLALIREGEFCGILDETLDSVVEYIETGQYHLPDYRPQVWYGLSHLVKAGREIGARTCVAELDCRATDEPGPEVWLVSADGSRTQFEHRWFALTGRHLNDLRQIAEFGPQTGPEFHGTVKLRDQEDGSTRTYRFTLAHELESSNLIFTMDLEPVAG